MTLEELARLLGDGIHDVALREAQGDLMELINRVKDALQARYVLGGRRETWVNLVALYPNRAIVREDNSGLLAYPYTLSPDGTITLSDPAKVEMDFSPVPPEQAASSQPSTDQSSTGQSVALMEAVAGAEPGRVFRIRVICAGLSGNGNFYSDRVLREAVPLFENVKVFVKSDAEHLRGQGKDVRNVIGKIDSIRFVEGAATDTGEVQAVLHVLQSAGDISARLTEALARGMTDMFGFSVDADARARKGKIGGKPAIIAAQLTRVRSVDLIVEPGAGGRLVQLVEAQGNTDMLRDEIIAKIKAHRPDLLGDPATLSDDAVLAKFREAFPDDAPPATAAPGLDPAAIARQVDTLVTERVAMREAVAASGLPKPAQERLLGDLGGRASVSAADVKAAIEDERTYLARFTESGRVSGLGGGPRIEVGVSQADKINAMFDAFFDPAHKDHIHARSFKECYREATGDRNITGRMAGGDSVRLREALNANSFAEVLGNSITRRMIADYRAQTNYDVWRMLAHVVPITDFRTQERTRFGGYGDLPAVAASDPYMPVTSPTDEKSTYAIAKKGGTEELTLEMVANDDVGAIQRIPTNLSRAAKRTLSKFVLDFLRVNPTTYDGKALFHADHGNLGSTALSAASLAAGRLAMLKQAEKDSGDPLGVGPKYLWVSPDNEETAVDLFRRSTQQDKNFVQSLALTVVPVWYWSDLNDWCLSADPLDIPVLEVGFFSGEEEPQVFIQDNPTVGSMFSHDKVTFKIRHIYGGAALDFRGVYKAVVA